MANGLYDPGRAAFLSGDLDWDAMDFRAILIDAGAYTVDRAAHQFLTSIPSGARLNVSGPLANKAVLAGGVADADDVTFTGGITATGEAVVIYQHTGADGTARLVYYGDTTAAGALAIPITSLDILIRWDNGANRIFKL